MSANPRQVELMTMVRDRGTASVEELAEALGVTLQTVRRDIARLAEEGLLARYHGGARMPSSTTENLGHAQREALNASGKQAIAAAIAAAIPNGSSLILNIGTTTEAVAKALLQHSGLRVITNNLNVASTLAANPRCEVIVAGGLVRAVDRGIIGESTVDFFRQFKVDMAVIGVSGIESDGTLRDFDLREVKVTQAIIDHARQVWLAADTTKFNRAAMVEVAHLSQIDRLYTDQAPPGPFAALIEEAGVELCLPSR